MAAVADNATGGRSDGDETVLVSTTFPRLPLPANDARPHIRTARLLVRPLQPSDLAGLHALRTQPEAMTGTRLGRPDRDLAETQTELDFFLGNNQKGDQDKDKGEGDDNNGPSTYLWGAFLPSTGELIGEGGVHTLASDDAVAGWPEIGYKFRKEHWGRGYATEFLDAVLGAWWGLPRNAVEMRVSRRAVAISADDDDAAPPRGGDDGDGDGDASAATVPTTEHVYANAEPGNVGSCRVLEKLGFRRFHEWTEPDTQEHRVGEPLDLVGYLLASPSPAAGSGK
ncbi:hypothetical protein PG989_008583 [Apiospora arundinis]